MTDYHGVIAAPGERVALGTLLAGLGARSFRFTGLRAGEIPPDAQLDAHATAVADLSGGFDAWMAAQLTAHPRFFKGKRRAARSIERDLGPLRLAWSRNDPELIDYVLRLKRAQYLRTRRHDVFACGWTEQLLRRLHETAEPDFGLSYARLYAGDTLVAAEVGLVGGDTHHLWLPVYELEHARYGPGMLMTLESVRAAAADGLKRVDFGRADADYKHYFAEPAGVVLEGCVRAKGATLTVAGDRLLAATPTSLGRLTALRERVRRRIDVIAACETTAWGWCAAAVLAIGIFTGAPSPTSHAPQPRRPHVQRSGPHLDAGTDGGLRQAAGDLHAPAG